MGALGMAESVPEQRDAHLKTKYKEWGPVEGVVNIRHGKAEDVEGGDVGPG